MLVRHVEVVAVTVSDEQRLLLRAVWNDGQSPDFDLNDDEETEILEDAATQEEIAGKVMAAQNLRDEERSKMEGEQGKHPPLVIKTPPISAHLSTASAGLWLVSVTARSTSFVAQEYPRTSVTFGMYLANIVELCKKTYTATSPEDIQAHKNLLRDYTLLISTAKIKGRIEKGTKLNRFDFLTKSGSDLINTLTREGLHFKSLLVGTSIFGKRFSEDELRFLKEAIEVLKTSENEIVTMDNQEAVQATQDLYKTLATFIQDLHADGTVHYDQQTAEALQTVLSAILINVKASFAKLFESRRTAQLYTAKNFDAREKPHV
jgi:hypothetical protein